jgi:hypothetical protein
MNSQEILRCMNVCFRDTTKLEKSYTNLLSYTKDILTKYTNLNRLGGVDPNHITNLMGNYKNRLNMFINILEKCNSGKIKVDDPEEILILCYDELLILYILAFSIYDSIYSLIDYTFRNYLFEKKILSENVIDLNLMKIVRQSTLFSSYDFPIMICMNLRGNLEFKKYFIEKTNVEVTKADEEIYKFTEALLCLMSYRNQVGHMSADLELFSMAKIENNYEKISLFVTVYQENLEKLMLLINNMTQDLINSNKIKKK